MKNSCNHSAFASRRFLRDEKRRDRHRICHDRRRHRRRHCRDRHGARHQGRRPVSRACHATDLSGSRHDQRPAFSPAGISVVLSASARRMRAEPGLSGCCWLACGAQPDSHTISKVARTRPSGSAKRSAIDLRHPQQRRAPHRLAPALAQYVGRAHAPQILHQRKRVRVTDDQRIDVGDRQRKAGALQQCAEIAQIGERARHAAKCRLRFRLRPARKTAATRSACRRPEARTETSHRV